MEQLAYAARRETHDVMNQTPPLVDYNLFATDRALVEALEREGGGWARTRVEEFGGALGAEPVIRWGFQANANEPVLHTHDRAGNRVDEVEFHPAWHSLLNLSIGYGLHCMPWMEPRPGAHVARTAMMMLAAQNEAGHLCPVSMTYSAVPALRKQANVARAWEARILSTQYDARFLPAERKSGVLIGMAMTEKQGGSDVRANTTKAEPAGGGEYRITGHKWFCSAPMCDAFLILAQAPRGLSCFLLPRWTPDGERNRFYIQRLKDKLGNRSNASSEVEFDGAWATMVGEEGRGVPAIIEMVMHTRLDCVTASTGIMRQGVTQALHHARHRSAFGKRLMEQPLMRNVLADLCVESEAATILMMRLARAFDRRESDEGEQAFARLATAAAKYWVCKRAITHAAEALESLGGNGYVEESIMPRLYRETPLNSVWEGAGNVICLDVLRAITKEPRSLEAVVDEIRLARGANKRLDAYAGALEKEFQSGIQESGARRLTEGIALALQGSLVVRFASAAVSDAFCASRLERNAPVFGTLGPDADLDGILVGSAKPTG